MSRSLILFSLIVCSTMESFGQEVDLVRLGYTKSEIVAEQIGMAASPDGKIIAFVYSDKTIKNFDVGVGKFIKRFKGPYLGNSNFQFDAALSTSFGEDNFFYVTATTNQASKPKR